MKPDMQAWIDQDEAKLRTTIRRYGWQITYVGGGMCSRPGCTNHEEVGPPFGYTIGLFGLDHPELLLFGLDLQTTAGVINDLGQRIRNGESLIPGQLLTFEHWPHRILPEVVPNPGDIVLGANRFYRRPARHSVPVLQLSYDDLHGRFPWEKECLTAELQPRPGTFRA